MAITTTDPRTFSSTRRWVEPVARAGYATKGVLYLLIGGLALAAALGEGGALGGAHRATATIGAQPFGEILLALVGAGMFAYAAWRLVQAILDPEGVTRRDPKKGVAMRLGWAASGAVHGAIGVAALQMAFGSGRGRGEGGWIADLMRWDHGPTIVAIIGVIVAAFAIYQIYKAWTLDFTRPLRLTEMSSRERRWAVRIGRAGLFARGLVFTLVGIGMARAGLAHDAGRASRGVGGALREIASHSYGTVLLALVAAGLVAYGIHQFVEARYRRIPNNAA